jgi:hypothetical protein
LGQADAALELFERVVAGGIFCYPAMSRDPWLDSVRERPAFARLMETVREKHVAASSEFARLDGERVLAG